MITQEMKDKGIHCRGQGFNCYNCKNKSKCIEYEECPEIIFDTEKNENMEKGFLVYKCRMCGKLNKKTHVPDGLTALISILHDNPIPKSWGANTLDKTELCNCDGNNIGVADLIGFEKD